MTTTVTEFDIESRNAVRHPVWLTASCRTSLGSATDVILSDLSTEGCAVNLAASLLRVGQQVAIRMSSLESLPGRVRWVKGRRAGVKFDRPLYGPVVEHLVRVQVGTEPEPSAPPPVALRRV